MVNIFYELIRNFISMFLTCYLIYWIVSLFRSAKGAKIAFILVTIDVIIHLIEPVRIIFYIPEYVDKLRANGNSITNDDVISLYVAYGAEILAVITSYLMFIYIFYGKNIIIKSARAREFEREFSGKGKSLLYLSRILMSIFAIAFIVIGIYLLININNKTIIAISILFFLLSLALITMLIRSFIGLKGREKVKTVQAKSNDYCFIIITNYNTYLFENESDISFKEALSGLDELYYIDEFGLIKGFEKKVIYGLRISNISSEELSKLKMKRVDNLKLENKLKELDKVHQKIITIDEDYNVVEEKDR